MIRTVTIDIVNENAYKLLQDLESLQLIRMRSGSDEPNLGGGSIASYKGVMTKQSVGDIDTQLTELRDAWEK